MTSIFVNGSCRTRGFEDRTCSEQHPRPCVLGEAADVAGVYAYLKRCNAMLFPLSIQHNGLWMGRRAALLLGDDRVTQRLSKPVLLQTTGKPGPRERAPACVSRYRSGRAFPAWSSLRMPLHTGSWQSTFSCCLR